MRAQSITRRRTLLVAALSFCILAIGLWVVPGAVGASEVVFPERETAQRLANRILYPNLLDFVPLMANHLVMEITVPQPLIGFSLREVDVRQRYGVYVIAIQSATGEMTFMPGPDHVLNADETLIAIGTDDNLGELERAEQPQHLAAEEEKE